MSNLASLVVEVSANVARFAGDMGKIAHLAEQHMKRVQAVSDAAGLALKGAFAGVSAGAFVAGIKGAIDMADHLNDLSKATGVAVEELGGIGFAASQAGADLDITAKAFGKLNLKIAEAAAGGKEASKLFDAVGVSVKDLSGRTKTADTIFAELATKFESYADGPEKAALGNAAFGKSYQDLLPLLADGGQALRDNIEYYKRFGGVTTEVAQKADQFNDTLGKIGLITSSFGRTLAAELLVPLQAVADEFLRIKERGSAFETLAKSIAGTVKSTAVDFAFLEFVVRAAVLGYEAFFAQIAKLDKLDFKGAREVREGFIADLARARTEFVALKNEIQGVKLYDPAKYDTKNVTLRGKVQAPALAVPGTDAKSKSAFAAFLDDLDRMVEKTTEGEYAMLRLKAAQIAATDPAAKLGDAYKRIAAIQSADSQKALADYIQQLDKEANAMAFQVSIMTKSTAEQERLSYATAKRAQAEEAVNAALKAGKPLTDDAAAALRQQTEDTIRYTDTIRRRRDETERAFGTGATRAFRAYVESANNAAKYAENFITGSLNHIEDALVNFAKTGKLSFGDLWRFMAEEFIRQQVRMQIASASGNGGWLAGLLDMLGKLGSPSVSSSYRDEGLNYPAPTGSGGSNLVANSLRAASNATAQSLDSRRTALGLAPIVNITNNHSGAEVSAGLGSNGQVEVMVREITNRVHGAVAADVRNATGPVAESMKARGVNLGNGSIRRA